MTAAAEEAVAKKPSGGGGGTTYYTIKLNTDGGNAMDNQRVRRNGKAAKPADPKKEGFVFAGWFTNSEMTEEYDFDKAVSGNLTLYAKWTVIQNRLLRRWNRTAGKIRLWT